MKPQERTKTGNTPIALSIAGSDSGGGAGIQADLKTFSALGVYGCSAITALTAQNTCAVDGVLGVAPEFVAAQIASIFADIRIGAIKIGMLADTAVMTAVRDTLKSVPGGTPPIVLDPVMVAKSGDALLPDAAVAGLRKIMLPMADILTPNLPELTRLVEAQKPVCNIKEMETAARHLLTLGPRAVLVKGGHLADADSIDLFVDRDGGSFRLSHPRIATRNTHGTGCTLSAAIAAELARGAEPHHAVRRAKEYISAAIAAADRLHIGHGHGPVHHFHRQWTHPTPEAQEAADNPIGET